MYTDLPASAAEILAASRALGPDGLPDAPPRAEPTVSWLYAPGQFELARLRRLVRDGFAANRFVHYSGNFGALQPRAWFRRQLDGAPSVLTLVAEEDAELRVTVDGKDIAVLVDGRVRRAELPAGGVVTVTAEAGDASPATFAVLHAAGSGSGEGWEASAEGREWFPACVRPGRPELPSHEEREPSVLVRPSRAYDGVYELDAPVLGRPLIRTAGTPRIGTGESREEALAEPAQQEARHDVVQLEDGRWTSVHPLGFRYLVVRDVEPEDVTVEASVHPAERRGAFVCSDERLSRIWATSSYTLRLCMHELMLDGIKRDRMPWAGDQALNTLSNAYAFADGDIARDSATALGLPRHGYVNGISDYSLWWVINSAFCSRYFGAPPFPMREAEQLHRFLERLGSYAQDDGTFFPREEPDGFGDASSGSVFIDWGVRVTDGGRHTALQLLWFWALTSGSALLEAARHPGASRWAAVAERVRTTLFREAWDEDAQAWREYLGGSVTGSSYPEFLAVLSRIHGDDVPAGVRTALLEARLPGTPFMASFALLGLARAGAPDAAVDRISHLWGSMLDAGARTFWEEFATDAAEPYAMYGRPFGKSLCHAWAAGPAALLPEIVLGIRPLEDGWTRFEVGPSLGTLEWAAAVVTVPDGELVVVADQATVTVDIPAGATLVHGGDEYRGPQRITLEWNSPADRSGGSTRIRSASTEAEGAGTRSSAASR